MTDKLDRARARGARAEALLRDELVQEVFNTIEANYVKAWKETDVSDKKRQRILHISVQVLHDFHREFVRLARDGRVAQAAIDRIAQ